MQKLDFIRRQPGITDFNMLVEKINEIIIKLASNKIKFLHPHYHLGKLNSIARASVHLALGFLGLGVGA